MLVKDTRAGIVHNLRYFDGLYVDTICGLRLRALTSGQEFELANSTKDYKWDMKLTCNKCKNEDGKERSLYE